MKNSNLHYATESSSVIHLKKKNSSNNLRKIASKADQAIAEEYRHSKMIKQSVQDSSNSNKVWGLRISEIGQYSIGFELYFFMLKQLSYLFLIISLISVWPIIENYYGNGLSQSQKSEVWTSLTIANQPRFLSTLSLEEAYSQLNSMQYPKIRLVIADLLYSAVFIYFIFYFAIKSKEAITKNTINNVTTADYSIEVKGLPSDSGVEEVKKYFSDLFGNVVEVYLARKYNGNLNTFQARHDLLVELEYQLAYAKLIGNKNIKKIVKISKKIEKFDKQINNSEFLNLENHELPVERGFIVFHSLLSRKNCLAEFKKSNFCFRKYKTRLLFRERYHLDVFSTSDPSDINWENLEYSTCKRVFRRALVFLLALIAISISTGIIYYLRTIDGGLPSSDTCYNTDTQYSNLSLTDAEKILTTSTEVYCYCNSIPLNKLLDNSNFSNYCSDYLQKRTYALLAKILTCVGVAFTNYFINLIFCYLSKFEKIVSKSKESVNLMTKVFVGMFINTALVILLVNADFSAISIFENIPYHEYIFTGTFTDLSRDWYSLVGYIITMNMLISIFSPHIITFLLIYPIDKLSRRFCLKKLLTQRELNKRFEPAEFDIATRYSQILNVLFCSLIFSSGIPLLNIFAFATFTSLFWIDKFLMVNYYAKPVRYSSHINTRFLLMLPFVIIAHSCFAIYTYGASDIFPERFFVNNGNLGFYTNSIYDRLTSTVGILNFSVVCLSLISFIFIYFKLEKSCLKKSNQNKVCDVNNDAERTFNKEINEIKEHGLHTYNIIENPQYKHLVLNMNSSAKTLKKMKTKSLTQVCELHEENV